ncbi:MAG: type II toxin-antitoxin system HicA family toxin [Candidatus Binatia bacterium]
MPARLRPVSGKVLLRKLQRAGFEVVRVRGSAHYLRHPRTQRFTSVHVHGNEDIPLGTLRAIVVEQAGLTVEEFNRL